MCQAAYYNFVQTSVNYSSIYGQQNKEQRTIKDFDLSWEVIIDLVIILNPTDCIFIRVREAEPFTRMMDIQNIQKSDRTVHPAINNVSYRTASVNVEGNFIQLTFIKHSSAYSSPELWGTFLQQQHNEILKILKKN